VTKTPLPLSLPLSLPPSRPPSPPPSEKKRKRRKRRRKKEEEEEEEKVRVIQVVGGTSDGCPIHFFVRKSQGRNHRATRPFGC